MLTKRQKRITRQIRIRADIYQAIRELALENGLTASKLADEILLANPEIHVLLTIRKKRIKSFNTALHKAMNRDAERITEDFNKKDFNK